MPSAVLHDCKRKHSPELIQHCGICRHCSNCECLQPSDTLCQQQCCILRQFMVRHMVLLSPLECCLECVTSRLHSALPASLCEVPFDSCLLYTVYVVSTCVATGVLIRFGPCFLAGSCGYSGELQMSALLGWRFRLLLLASRTLCRSRNSAGVHHAAARHHAQYMPLILLVPWQFCIGVLAASSKNGAVRLGLLEDVLFCRYCTDAAYAMCRLCTNISTCQLPVRGAGCQWGAAPHNQVGVCRGDVCIDIVCLIVVAR
jgi:hypothetical protein